MFEVLEKSKNFSLIGSFRRFGDYGVAYEVIDINEQDALATVRVIETGETLSYPLAHARQDPKA